MALPKKPTTIVIRPPDESKKWWIIGGIALLTVAVIVVFMLFFAPESTTQLDTELGAVTEGDAKELAMAQWRGADSSHHASGTVSLLQDDRGLFLFFDDFESTPGPDVYLYVSTNPSGQWKSNEVTKVLVDGGAKDGQATLRGSFRVDLPASVQASSVQSAILWCDDFGVKFGHALFS